MDSFQIKWRFTESKYDLLPNEDLQQWIPLNAKASKYLWETLSLQKIRHDEQIFFGSAQDDESE